MKSICIICDWIYENQSKLHKKWNPFYCLTLKLRTLQTYQAHGKRWPSLFTQKDFADLVKPQRCTTESVRPLNSINKDVGGAKLLLMTTSVYHVVCACICPLAKTQHHCLCPNGSCTHLRLPTHPATHSPTPLYMPLMILQSLWKKFYQNPAVLAS